MQTQLTQSQAPTPANPYLDKFEAQEWDSRHPAWLYPVRKAALARFAELGFPTQADEDWRFTNLAPIVNLPFEPVPASSRARLKPSALKKFRFAEVHAVCLVFVNGYFSSELSTPPVSKSGVYLGSLSTALAQNSALLEKYLPRATRADQNPFAALNTAYFHDGAFIFVPRGQSSPPVHLLFVQTAEDGGAVFPRNLIVTEPDSRLTVIESYVSLGRASYLTNAVSDFVIGDGSVVEHLKFQDESAAAFHLATLPMRLGANVDFISHSIALGAKLSRNNILTVLDGENVNCVLNGLYLTRDAQLADHWMRVEHAKPQGASHEYFNGILEDRSRGVFHGRILVQPEAQKTDAKQTNKNLLLSDQATVNTKPQLEIYADDVKCTHGATVGQLNEESIFYLRARGLGKETARRMLIHAFAGEIIERIRCEPLRLELNQRIWDHLEQAPALAQKG